MAFNLATFLKDPSKLPKTKEGIQEAVDAITSNKDLQKLGSSASITLKNWARMAQNALKTLNTKTNLNEKTRNGLSESDENKYSAMMKQYSSLLKDKSTSGKAKAAAKSTEMKDFIQAKAVPEGQRVLNDAWKWASGTAQPTKAKELTKDYTSAISEANSKYSNALENVANATAGFPKDQSQWTAAQKATAAKWQTKADELYTKYTPVLAAYGAPALNKSQVLSQDAAGNFTGTGIVQPVGAVPGGPAATTPIQTQTTVTPTTPVAGSPTPTVASGLSTQQNTAAQRQAQIEAEAFSKSTQAQADAATPTASIATSATPGSTATAPAAGALPSTSTAPATPIVTPTSTVTGQNFYRVGTDIFEAGTNRKLGPTEWGQSWANNPASKEVAAPSTVTAAPSSIISPPAAVTTTTAAPAASTVPSTDKQFYRVGADIFEAGTGRHIGPTEWGTDWATAGAKEVSAPPSSTTPPATTSTTSSKPFTTEGSPKVFAPDGTISSEYAAYVNGTTPPPTPPTTTSPSVDVPSVIPSDIYQTSSSSVKTPFDINALLSQQQALQQQYLASSQPKQTEIDLQHQIEAIRAQESQQTLNAQAGMNKIEDQTIPMELITGQQASLSRQANLQLQTLSDREKNLLTDLGLTQQASQLQTQGLKDAVTFAQQNLGTLMDVWNQVSAQEDRVLARTQALDAAAQGKLTTILDQFKGLTYDQLSPSGQAALSRLAAQAGLPTDLIQQGMKVVADQLSAQALATQMDTAYKVQTQQDQQVDSLAKQFGGEDAVKYFNLALTANEFAKGVDPNTTNPGDDLGLIYSLAKVFDPNSVVREGEFKSAQDNMSSMEQALGAKLNQVMDGTGFLDSTVRQKIKEAVASKFGTFEQQYTGIRNEYANQINQRTGRNDGADFLINYANGTTNSSSPVFESALNSVLQNSTSTAGTSSGSLGGYSIGGSSGGLNLDTAFNSGGLSFSSDLSTSQNGSLGALSSKFESNGNPGVIGYDSTGGYSYGTFQLAHDNAKTFIAQSPYAEAFKGLTFNSPQWQQRWKEIAITDPQNFANAQKQYIQETHYDPQISKLTKAGVDVGSFSSVLKDVIWSTAVQHGGNTDIVVNALKKVGPNATDAQKIQAIYNERWSGGQNFASSTPAVQQSVYNRFFGTNGEMNMALSLLKNSSNIA